MPMIPDDDEDYDEFMDRCISEMADSNPDWDEDRLIAACSNMWDERRGKAMVRKTTARAPHIDKDGVDFILSDETVDRMGDVIVAAGWQLDNFQKNPIALFNHSSNFPIGAWEGLRVDGTALRGKLRLAPEGTSDRIDEIRRLVQAGILRAVSVGFSPTETPKPRGEKTPGYIFAKQELVETSLVSVPANPNALAIAKSLQVSRETLNLVFAGQGNGNEVRRRGLTAGQGETKSSNRKPQTMSLAQRITESQGRLNVLRDALQQHLDQSDDMDVTDADLTKRKELNEKIDLENKRHESLIESEKALGNRIKDEHEIHMPVRKVEAPPSGTRLYPEPAKKHQPGDYIWKSLVVLAKLQGDRYRKATALDVLRDTVGENEQARAVFSAVVGKAAAVPALTTTTGWAAELVRIEYGAWLESLQPASVLARLITRGRQFSFANNGIISIPTRSATPTIAGSFVGEGAAIPVRQGAFTAIQLIPKKMAVITTFSREISEHSDPAIEGILRQAIVEDTAVAADSVLLDASAATAVRPPGLRNGLATLTPTAGGGFNAVVGDVKLLAGALLTPTLGQLRNPVWLMPPNLALALKLTVAPNGYLVFSDEISRGSFLGWPVIESSNVTADTLYLIDAADFVSVSGETRFDISDTATVHMEDTTPLPISSTGTPNTVAAPVRSFWQTDTLGIRMIMQMNWAMLRAGMIAYITGVTWK